MLRALLMGAVYAALVPGAPMPLPVLRAELFGRYGLAWEQGTPPEGDESSGAQGAHAGDLSRFFATDRRDDVRAEPVARRQGAAQQGAGRPAPEGPEGACSPAPEGS
jgi:hypothetical protein